MSTTLLREPSLPRVPDLVGLVPRLLQMQLHGREERALVRLGRRLGFPEVAVLTLDAKGRGAGPELQAGTPGLSVRLEAEALRSAGPREWITGIRTARRLGRDVHTDAEAQRMLQRLDLDHALFLPLRSGTRLLLLGDGPIPDDDTLSTLIALARTLMRAAAEQGRHQENRREVEALRRQMVHDHAAARRLRGENTRLERLQRLMDRMEPVSAGIKELTRATAEAVGETLDASLVVLVRPARSEVWLACEPDHDTQDLEPLVRDALARAELGGLERYHQHRVDAKLGNLSEDHASGFAVACSRPSLDGDQVLAVSLRRDGFADSETRFLETAVARMLRSLAEREMVGRILEHAQFLERRLDQVVASYRIARTLAMGVSDSEAPGRILWDVRQSFHADAAVLLFEAPDGGAPMAVSAIEGGEVQDGAFLGWAVSEYRTRFDPGLPDELLVRRTNPVDAKLGEARRESFAGPEDVGRWWPSRVVAPFSMGNGAPGLLCLGSRRPGEFGAEAETALRILAGDAAQTLGHLYGLAVQERRLLQQLVAYLPTAILLVSGDGELRVTNLAATQLLRLSDADPRTVEDLEEICGLDLGLLVAEARAREDDVLAREIVWGEQDPRYLRADASRVLDAAGREIGVLLALRDVTRSKRLELEQAEFVGTVSHELRTPLTSMKTALELILQEEAGPVTEEQAHFLEMTRRNIDRLGRLIQQLLDVARHEAGRLRLDRQRADLTQLLAPSLESFQRTATQQGRTLTWDLDAGLDAFVDPDRFLEILENLVGNALKFTEPGGRIRVHVRGAAPCPSVESRQLARALDRDLAGVELMVEDDGPGMDVEAKQRAFERFYQAGDPLAGRPDGAGLGLAITRALVGAHDGRVRVESEPGQGTRILVWIPADAGSGRVTGAVAWIEAEVSRIQQRLRAGTLLAIALGPDSDGTAGHLRAILAERGIPAERLWCDEDPMAWLVVSDTEYGGVLQRQLESLLRRHGGRAGRAAFPADATAPGTLLAMALQRTQSQPGPAEGPTPEEDR